MIKLVSPNVGHLLIIHQANPENSIDDKYIDGAA